MLLKDCWTLFRRWYRILSWLNPRRLLNIWVKMSTNSNNKHLATVWQLLGSCWDSYWDNTHRSGYAWTAHSKIISFVKIYESKREKFSIWHFISPSISIAVATKYYNPKIRTHHRSVSTIFIYKRLKMLISSRYRIFRMLGYGISLHHIPMLMSATCTLRGILSQEIFSYG